MDNITVDLHCNEDGVWTDETPKKGRFARIKEGALTKVAQAKSAIGGFVERNQELIEAGSIGTVVTFLASAACTAGLGLGLVGLAALTGSAVNTSEDGEEPSEDSSEGGIEE